MSKALGSWSAMRKYLEEEMLCESLRGRIRYAHTKYSNMDTCWGIFEVFADGNLLKRFSAETMGKEMQTDGKIWETYWAEKKKPVESRNAFDDEDFADGLVLYRSLPISEALNSENPIVRMFAVLDRRVGKRTLKKLKDNISNQPEWLRVFYIMRTQAENI